jgi:tol-pal system protein YbgF
MIIRRFMPATAVVAFLAATAGSAVAQDGRLSLAERVARLEQQGQSQPANTGGGNLELLNRFQELQSEMQSLRGLIEQQSFEIEELKKRQRDQYVDLDSRIERLRGGAAGADAGETLDLSSPGASTVGTPPPAIPAAPSDPNQLQMQDAEAVDPYTGEPLSRQTDSDPSGSTGTAGSTDPGSLPATSGSGDALADYQAAFDALKQGRYDQSTTLFNGFMRQYPDHELADNAMYWLGESYYVTQNYDTALQTFRDLIQRYPDGEKTADAELKIGYCLYELGNHVEAQAALAGVVQRYPDSTVARLAESRLRALALEQR